MTRLTADIRAKTVSNIIKAKMTDDYIALCDRIAAVAHILYKKYIPQFVLELPKGTVPETNHIHVQVGDDHISYRFNGFFEVKDMDENYNRRVDYSFMFGKRDHIYMPFPYNINNTCVAQIISGHTLYPDLRTINEEIDAFVKRFFESRKKMNSILASVASVAKLLEVWPEVEPYIPEEAPKPKLPALPVSEINSMLRLP